MKKFALLIIAVFLSVSIFAQEEKDEDDKNKFNIGLDIFSDIWADAPDETDLSTINRGLSVFGMYNYQFGESNFSFAIGAGITAHNMYHNADIYTDTQLDSTGFMAIDDSISFKKSKLNLTYLDIPFEFRLKTENKFRLALGFKLGYLLHKHNKYKGDVGEFSDVITKTTNVNYLENFRYGPTCRVGYKWFNLMAYYQISKIFKPDQGPEMAPFSVGISLMPF